jgi:hypothetical protein
MWKRRREQMHSQQTISMVDLLQVPKQQTQAAVIGRPKLVIMSAPVAEHDYF